MPAHPESIILSPNIIIVFFNNNNNKNKKDGKMARILGLILQNNIIYKLEVYMLNKYFVIQKMASE